MVDTFIERGFTYFDTAWMYCAFKSENAVKEALVSRHPRDSFTLTTKLHSSFVNSFEDRDRIFNEQMEKTGVTYFDYYLIHDITAIALRRTISLMLRLDPRQERKGPCKAHRLLVPRRPGAVGRSADRAPRI